MRGTVEFYVQCVCRCVGCRSSGVTRRRMLVTPPRVIMGLLVTNSGGGWAGGEARHRGKAAVTGPTTCQHRRMRNSPRRNASYATLHRRSAALRATRFSGCRCGCARSWCRERPAASHLACVLGLHLLCRCDASPPRQRAHRKKRSIRRCGTSASQPTLTRARRR